MVCPFDVITYHPVAGPSAPYIAATTTGPGRVAATASGAGDGNATRPVAVKCDACIVRQREGRIPACVEVCKVGALQFGDVNAFVAAGQRRETVTVLTATSPTEAARSTLPAADPLEAWRELGASVGSPANRQPAISHPGGAR
jgi:Fe-S-cluster-containing dehydrogenase component